MNRKMRKLTILLFFSIVMIGKAFADPGIVDEPDTAYLFAYSTNNGRSGLNLAWSIDREEWHAIGPEHTFLFSDFGRWGSQKRMFDPYLFLDENEVWHCLWSLNDTVQQFAHAASKNLYEWKRQSYPVVMNEVTGNVQELEVTREGEGYRITWRSAGEGLDGIFQVTTAGFKDYSPTESATEAARLNDREEVDINGVIHRGMIQQVAWELVEGLIKHQEWMRFHNAERAERMVDDPIRFAGLESPEVEVVLQPGQTKEISDMLIGIFFEDINYAADGGLYAERIQNRDFEYHPGDRLYRDNDWTSKKAWSVTGEVAFEIATADPVHVNNEHYAVLDVQRKGAALINEGWDGIPVEAGKQYDFSVFARTPGRSRSGLTIRLRDSAGRVVGETEISRVTGNWKKHEAVLTATASAPDAKLEIVPQRRGRIDLDMISLFPRHTFKNRRNGLRADLAQAIADLNPKFVRFPGGCVAHGDGIANMYRWENTIGPLESRVPQRNIWGYHQTAGLGYFEYFQFCEDIGAEPIPVVPAGVPCQNSATGGHGQQCGIPMDEMDDYVQSVLNLIEWANGDADTEWGRKRAEAGHPAPFNLKYLGVGNEDLITDIFEERFTMIYNAVREKHPEITVIGTVGPFYRGTDYEEGWDLARKLDLQIVDEHYYQPPGWFINNQDYYDKYDRNGPKVYLGEYAAHLPGRPMNMETALSEALYLTAVERNGDIVRMTSFAPLLAKENHTQWNPDLIYFNNTEVKPTVDYYVQQLFGRHAGNRYIPSQVNLSNADESVRERVGISVVRDDVRGDLILKLVNLLPVDVEANIDLSAYSLAEEGTLIVLEGQPVEEDVRPVEKTIGLSEALDYRLPAYSFSVIRVRVE